MISLQPLTAISSLNTENSIAITFQDGMTAYYSENTLRLFPIFQEDKSKWFVIEDEKVSKSYLDVWVKMFCCRKLLGDICSEEELSSEEFYNGLRACADYLFQDRASLAHDLINEEMLTIPYSALHTLANKRKTDDGVAQLIIDKYYFCVGIESTYQRTKNFQLEVLAALNERDLHKRNIEVLSDKLQPFTHFYDMLASPESAENLKLTIPLFFKGITTELNSRIESLTTKEANARVSINVSVEEAFRIASRTNDTCDIKAVRESIAAMSIWNRFKAVVNIILQYSCLSTDLVASFQSNEMPFVALLRHYNLAPFLADEAWHSRKFGFKHKDAGQICSEQLEGSSLYQLEESIRKKILRYKSNLPTRLYPEDTSCSIFVCEKIVDINFQNLKERIFSVFAQARMAGIEEENKLKNELIKLWDWEKYGIECNSLSFHPLPAGFDRMLFFGRHKKFKFYFNFSDFKPIIFADQIEISPEATIKFLEDAHKANWRYVSKPHKFVPFKMSELFFQ